MPAARDCSNSAITQGERIHTCVICRAQLYVCNTLLGQAGLYYCISLLAGWEPLLMQVSWLFLLHLALSTAVLSWSSSRDSIATAQLHYHRWGHPAAQPRYCEPSRGPSPGWQQQPGHLLSGPACISSVDVRGWLEMVPGCSRWKHSVGRHAVPWLSRAPAWSGESAVQSGEHGWRIFPQLLPHWCIAVYIRAALPTRSAWSSLLLTLPASLSLFKWAFFFIGFEHSCL